MTRPCLTARWESLLLLTFDCPPELLAPLVPRGTELDPWKGRHIVSMVGFRFLETRVKGVAVPGHRDFTEANLRFYVRRRVPGGAARRAVVFVREVVPLPAVALIARLVYNEPYLRARMSHQVELDAENGGSLRYEWVRGEERHHLAATAEGPAESLEEGSEAEFVTEHYWGYTRQRDGRTLEYEVAHPPWLVWKGRNAEYSSSGGGELYGPQFARMLATPPRAS